MKNRLFILTALVLILGSCATPRKYAANSFEDPIYNSSRSTTVVVAKGPKERTERTEIKELREKTKQKRFIVDGKIVEAAYADEQGNVQIDALPGKTYIVLEEGESFEERLNKFESPTYTININHNIFDYADPWFWAEYYNPLYPYYYYYGYHYGYPYYINPFRSYYMSWGWPFYHYNSWIWWDYRYLYPDPYWAGHWHYPYSGHPKLRDRFYGRRESRRETENRPYAYTNSSTSRSSGSYTRRSTSRIEQIRGLNPYNNSTSKTSSDRSGSSLRRESSRYSRITSKENNAYSPVKRESSGTISRKSTTTYRPSRNSNISRSSEQRSSSSSSSGNNYRTERRYSTPAKNTTTSTYSTGSSSRSRSSSTGTSISRSSSQSRSSSTGTSTSRSSSRSNSSTSRYRR